MGASARRKGARGEASAKLLLAERDWQVFPRPRGESGDDFTAIDPIGKLWSVEVKNTKSLLYAMWCQCRHNAGKRQRMLLWRPSGWGLPAGLWIAFQWPKGCEAEVHVWRAR